MISERHREIKRRRHRREKTLKARRKAAAADFHSLRRAAVGVLSRAGVLTLSPPSSGEA